MVSTSIPYEEIFSENFDHRDSDTLMDSLSVGTVEKAAHKLWNRSREDVNQ